MTARCDGTLAVLWGTTPKARTGFGRRSCSNKKLERDVWITFGWEMSSRSRIAEYPIVKYAAWNVDRAHALVAEHIDREGPLLPILHAFQEEFGCINSAAERLIALALNISRAEVHGVVTFYHDFRGAPPGRHVLKLCRAEACQAAGGDALAAQAQAQLGIAMGETTPKGGVTLEAVYCLGLCAVAPSAMLDGRLVGRLDEGQLDALLAEARK